MFTTWKRIIQFGWKGFQSNRIASAITVFVMTLAVLLVGSWFVFQGLSQEIIATIEGQMGISVYFHREIGEDEISSVEDQLTIQFPQTLKDMRYISSEQALEEFKERHGGEALYEQALEEVGSSAIRPSLEISAYEEKQYQEINEYLIETFPSLIYQTDYLNRQKVINKAFSLIRRLNYFSLFIGLILVSLVILVVFNTIRLALYAVREEIETMKLVGASNRFTWGPFVVQGAIYGLLAFLIANLLFLPLIYWASPQLSLLLPSFNLWVYYQSHWLVLLLMQLGGSLLLGMVSTFFATRCYLKI
jgi:cell division transport system permease protein